MAGFPANIPNLLEPEPEPEKECFKCIQNPNKDHTKIKVHPKSPNPKPIPDLINKKREKICGCC